MFLVLAGLGEAILGADARLADEAVSEGALAVIDVSLRYVSEIMQNKHVR